MKYSQDLDRADDLITSLISQRGREQRNPFLRDSVESVDANQANRHSSQERLIVLGNGRHWISASDVSTGRSQEVEPSFSLEVPNSSAHHYNSRARSFLVRSTSDGRPAFLNERIDQQQQLTSQQWKEETLSLLERAMAIVDEGLLEIENEGVCLIDGLRI